MAGMLVTTVAAFRHEQQPAQGGLRLGRAPRSKICWGKGLGESGWRRRRVLSRASEERPEEQIEDIEARLYSGFVF